MIMDFHTDSERKYLRAEAWRLGELVNELGAELESARSAHKDGETKADRHANEQPRKGRDTYS